MGKKFSSFIDAHCHITKRSYNLLEIETIALKIKSNNIEFIINNGGHPEENEEVIKLAKEIPELKAWSESIQKLVKIKMIISKLKNCC
ncbi:hypothetical protein ONA23_02790 [Mycoplasmopsis cynos]|uniref:hypothetical protein n=1 Tax=Mycoplasmopsis cynos TaxID=171284 RepID=UPI00220D84CF|nr:hypothetical protein [Mycoplasmopsis cynos]UWV93472.1 hypothetical protein NW062_05980 [Mycoplasmopsis cynos]WAM07264.1 hypothetical protein ONA23_02790 [Mycoplasmopsis cynos]